MEVSLNTGQIMPSIGLGTWKSAPNQVTSAVEAAIDCGYRHIDCARLYKNEDEVGRAIARKIEDGTVKREELFVTTKLWNTNHRPEDVGPAFEASLKDLGLDYVDLYLMHFPFGFKNSGSGDFFPQDQDGNRLVDNVDYIDTWKAMEGLLKTGKTKAIGVSNFNEYQLRRVCGEGTVKPAVNQVECHPYLIQTQMMSLCKELGIAVVGYSPFGSPDRYWASPDEPRLLDEPIIVDIATKLGRTSAQVLLRFNLQRGVTVIPKSVTPSRIQSNYEIYDFTLSEDDMQRILSLNRNWRALDMQLEKNHKYFPFRNDYSE